MPPMNTIFFDVYTAFLGFTVNSATFQSSGEGSLQNKKTKKKKKKKKKKKSTIKSSVGAGVIYAETARSAKIIGCLPLLFIYI